MGGCEWVSVAPCVTMGGPCWESGGVILQAGCMGSATVFECGLLCVWVKCCVHV